MRKSLIVLSVVLLAFGVWGQSTRRDGVGSLPASSYRCVSENRCRANPRSCAFTCRTICWKVAAPEQRGGDIAAEYIATQFFALRVEARWRQRDLHAEGSDGGRHAASRDYIFPSFPPPAPLNR